MRCHVSFLKWQSYQAHINGQSKCVTRLRTGTALDEIRKLYIAANGISDSYQKLTSKETRHMMFNSEWLSEISPETISVLETVDLQLGHALNPKKTLATFTPDSRSWLLEKYNTGVQTPTRKADPAQVAKEMRRVKHKDTVGNEVLRFSQEHWLSEEQIRSFFSRTFAKQKNKTAKGKEPNADQISDAEATLRYQDYHVRQNTVLEEAADPSNNTHPITLGDLDICALAENISKSSSLKDSQVHDFEMKELKSIVQQLGEEVTAQRVSRKIIANSIVSHVNTKCTECKDTLMK